MAGVAALAIRREDAFTSITTASERLHADLGIEIEPMPQRGKDLELLRVEQLEWVATTLSAVAAGQTGAGGDAPAVDEGPNLADMKRADLDALATEHGIEHPERFKNRAEVIAAIEAAQAAADAAEAAQKLDVLDRGSLNVVAADHGVEDAADLPNKDAVIAAIAEADQPPADTGEQA